jgi:hypothetical protein
MLSPPVLTMNEGRAARCARDPAAAGWRGVVVSLLPLCSRWCRFFPFHSRCARGGAAFFPCENGAFIRKIEAPKGRLAAAPRTAGALPLPMATALRALRRLAPAAPRLARSSTPSSTSCSSSSTTTLFFSSAPASASPAPPPCARRTLHAGARASFGFGSHVCDNDPVVLELEKERNLHDPGSIPGRGGVPDVAGWNEKLASDSEAVVRARARVGGCADVLARAQRVDACARTRTRIAACSFLCCARCCAHIAR